MSSKSISRLLGHFSVLLFGGVGVLAAVSGLDALSISAGRCAFGALGLLLFLSARRKTMRPMVSTWPQGLLLTAHWYSFFLAIEWGSVELGLLCFSCYPLFTFSLRKLKGEKTHRSEFLCSLSIVLGMICLNIGHGFLATGGIPMLVGLASALMFALLQWRNHHQRETLDAISLSYGQLCWAALLFAPVLLWQGNTYSLSDLAWLMLFGLVFTALAHTLFIYAQATIGAQEASFIASAEPLYGIALAFVIWEVRSDVWLWPAILFIVIIPGLLTLDFGKRRFLNNFGKNR